MEIVILFFACVGGCSLIFKILANILLGKPQRGITIIDKTVHHHYHDNRSVTYNGEKLKNNLKK